MTETGNAENPAATESAYGTALEEVFIAERGTPFLLSSKDWQVIRGWLERGIPADTAIRAIHETFDKRRARGAVGKIASISYCANAVEERWELERRGLVGKNDGLPDIAVGSIPERIAKLVAALGAVTETDGADGKAVAKGIARAVEKLRELSTDKGFDQMEQELVEIETALIRKGQKALGEALTSELARRVDEALGPPDGASLEIRERTRKALARREVRRLLGLPPLTLFDV